MMYTKRKPLLYSRLLQCQLWVQCHQPIPGIEGFLCRIGHYSCLTIFKVFNCRGVGWTGKTGRKTGHKLISSHLWLNSYSLIISFVQFSKAWARIDHWIAHTMFLSCRICWQIIKKDYIVIGAAKVLDAFIVRQNYHSVRFIWDLSLALKINIPI